MEATDTTYYPGPHLLQTSCFILLTRTSSLARTDGLTLVATHEYTQAGTQVLRAPAQHLSTNEDTQLPNAVEITSTSVVGAGQK